MNNKNKFYLKKISDNKKEKFGILFDSKIENKDNNFNKTLQEFINLQKDNKKIDLNSIYFREKIDNNFFQNIIDKELEFANCTFLEEVYFTDLNFKEKINFEGSTFKEIANFNRVIFKKNCSFENVKFKEEVEFKNTIFQNDAKFSTSRFNKFTSFEEAKFNKEADFTNIIAEDLFFFYKVSLGKLNLIGSYFDKANFLMLHNNDKNDKPLKKENIKNKDTARLLKAHFEKENNIIDANIYFALEQEFYLDLVNNKNSKYSNRLINKIPILFNNYISNYGTDWLRVLIVLFGFGFLASIFYGFFNNPVNIDSEKYKNYLINFNYKYWLWVGLLLSIIFYILHQKKKKIFKLIFFIGIMYYIQALFLYKSLWLTTNSIILLINPLNIFNQDKIVLNNKTILKNINYFENISLYGIIVKIILMGLIYQFIISFKNNTRRK